MTGHRDDDLWFVEVTAPLPSSRVQVVAAEASARLKLPTEKLVALLDNRVGPVTKPLPRASAERVADVLDAAGAEVAMRRSNAPASDATSSASAPEVTSTPATADRATATPSTMREGDDDDRSDGTIASEVEEPAANVAAHGPDRNEAPGAPKDDGAATTGWKPPLLRREPSASQSAGTPRGAERKESPPAKDRRVQERTSSHAAASHGSTAAASPRDHGATDDAEPNRTKTDSPSDRSSAGLESSPSDHGDPWTRMVDADDDEDLGSWVAPHRSSSGSARDQAKPPADTIIETGSSESASSTEDVRAQGDDDGGGGTPPEPALDTSVRHATDEFAMSSPVPRHVAGPTGSHAPDASVRDEMGYADDVPDVENRWRGRVRNPFAEAERRERLVRRLVLGTFLLVAVGVLVALQFT